ncbi:hypothetical protein Tco_0295474 [Tanacetum coccineum]
MTLHDPNIYVSDSTFSGGGDDEGSAAANSVMHVSADGDCGKQTHQSQMPLYPQLEGTRSSVGTAEGSAEARMVSRILLILFRIGVNNVAWTFCQRLQESKGQRLQLLQDKDFQALRKISDEQVLLAEDQAWMESSNSEESTSSAEETLAEVSYYTSDSESESEYETSEYYDNSTNLDTIVQIGFGIIGTGVQRAYDRVNRALLTNIVEKFLGTVRVLAIMILTLIAAMDMLLIGSMTIKKVSMVEGLWYPKDSGFDLTAYSDADHAGCHLDRKSTSGSVQFLGDKLVCWSSKKQNCVSISTAESEYVVVSGCCAQVLWMRTQLTDYGFFYDKVPIYCDSKSAIAISCNPVQHTRTKHIDVRYHFIKDHVEKGTIELYFVGTEFQLADLFTKSLPEARFKFLVEKLGMMSRET